MSVTNQKLDFENTQEQILSGLNESQLKAVTHRNGPLLIIAGAGTGKTSVITRRIAYIIEQKWALPSEILALTFTEKAAAEMEERVDMLVPYGFTDMWMSTFNAFGDRFLRDYSLDIGLPANFKVLSATEQMIFMREHLYAFELKHYRPVSSPASHIKSLINHFSRLKDELISPEQYQDYAQTKHLAAQKSSDSEQIVEAEKALELANAYSRYQELMIQSGNLDYGDQLYLVNKVLDENISVLRKIRQRFKYILVDEFQDTNYAQNELVKKIAGIDGNVTVVGDDDQSIYRFRGASISNILQFNRDYKDISQIVLNQNYRSSQQILDAAYRLIQNNNPDRLEVQNKINKRLISSKNGEAPLLLHSATLSCEADSVANKIKELKNKHGLQYKDFAILVRANNHALPFIQSLNMSGIPFIFSGASSLLQQPEIRMLVSFLRLLINPDDSLAFFHLATSELYNISAEEMAKLYSSAKQNNRQIEEIVGNGDFAELQSVCNDLSSYRRDITTLNAGELLYKYLSNKGTLKKWINTKSVSDEIKVYRVAAFFERLANFNHASDDPSIPAFLQALELIIEAGDDSQSNEIDSNVDAVNILTAHAAKGLEYEVVFIVNAVAGRFPGADRKDPLPIPDELLKEKLSSEDFHIQEERRLFYVAATRAKQFLFITSAEDYGGKRAKKLSPFVMELFGESRPEAITHRLSPLEKIERFKKVMSETTVPKALSDRKDNLRLSRAQIDDYHTCPQKYYLTHIVKIPLMENQALMFGTAIHAALNHHFSRKALGQELSLELLISDYKAAFRNVGFITREHEEQRLRSGIEVLTKFFQEDQIDHRLPAEIESSFEFCQGQIKVNGRYDLIYKENGITEICDFKTGNVATQKDADRRIKESTQMQMYALAWQKKFSEIPKTTLYFIESGLRAEIIYNQKDLDKTEQMIEEVAEGICKQNFIAKPDLRSCQFCAFSQICPDSVI